MGADGVKAKKTIQKTAIKYFKFNMKFWMGFHCVAVLVCFIPRLKKTDLSVLMINILIKIVTTIIYMNEKVFVF